MWTNQQHTKDLGDKRGQFSDWNRGDDCHILYCADLWKHCDWADWVCGTGTVNTACMFVSADFICRILSRQISDSAYHDEKGKKVTVQLLHRMGHLVFRQQKVRYRVRVQIHFPGMPEISGGTVRTDAPMQCMEKHCSTFLIVGKL